jgi:ParB family chromosome partitioning protein
MTTDKYLSYRGDVKAVAGVGSDLVFVTCHPERHATGLYRVETDKFTMTHVALPEGGRDLAVDGDAVWVAGSDGYVYHVPAKGAPSPRGPKFAGDLVAVTLLPGDRLAVLFGAKVAIVQRKDGKLLQELDLPEVGSCLASPTSGEWLVVGTQKGTVLVFEGEGKPSFALSASDKLHDGAVTALLFEPDDLRFWSAGADLKLLSTYARGSLEPEDRGRGNMHAEPITALTGWDFDRLFSGSRDATIKSWPRGSNIRPVTHKDGVAQIVDLAVVKIHTKPHLVACCGDNTVRLFRLDDTGRVEELTHRFYDALASAKNELKATDGARREATLKKLAGYGDAASLEMVATQMTEDGDHIVRQHAAQLLSDSAHPRAAKLLEPGLNETFEKVRIAAFHGLRKHLGDADLRPLDLALKTGRPELGKLAVQALEPLAAKDDQALTRLSDALNAGTLEVRQAALTSLEKAYDAKSPEANLQALASQHPDVRRLALVRLFQRKLLNLPKVQAALRWRSEDTDAEVRRTAFLLSLHTRPKLLDALRKLDPELQRQLVELEAITPDGTPAPPAKPADPAPAVDPATLKVDEENREPLLQATASRSLDTCLRGARGLAMLRDPRAFGLLLQLSREDNKHARVEVCAALAALNDPRALGRLRSLMSDGEASVRDGACTAFLHMRRDEPLAAAEACLSAPNEDVRKRGLQSLLTTMRAGALPPSDNAAWALALRALNDGAAGVRREAFKAVLNLPLPGAPVENLRFLLQSAHADMRREVQTEAMAQSGEPWAWSLLLEFFNDPDAPLRDETLAFALKKNKDRDVETLGAALQSRYADLRLQAVDGLAKKHTKPAQAFLSQSLDDAESTVRLKALAALVDDDTRPALILALQSKHDDVRIGAARTLASHGVAEAAAALLQQVRTPKPKEAERESDWAKLVEAASLGLGQLGDPAAVVALLPLLDDPRAELRRAAAQALALLARPGQVEPLRQAMQHSDPQVSVRAALGLCFAGDPHGLPIVLSSEARAILEPLDLLAACLACGADDALATLLDDADESLRTATLLVHLLLELADPRGAPTRCMACLSSRMPRVRLAAARALEVIAQPDEFARFVVETINDRADQQAWKIDPAVVRGFADLLAFGPSWLAARTVPLLRNLAPREQHAWDAHWNQHAQRFASEIAAIAKQPRTPAKREIEPAALAQLAFGAYVGLVREQGSGPGNQLPLVLRVRQTALARVTALASADAGYRSAARAVCVQALGDPNQPVRMQAFDALGSLGMEPTALGSEALESGHLDLAVKGLELLTDGTRAAEGEKVLEQVLLTRRDDLAAESAKLLAARRGRVAVAVMSLAAAHEPLRRQAVAWLSEDYDADSAAQQALRQALDSRYQKVRDAAAVVLGAKKDPLAFDALAKALSKADTRETQAPIIAALATLGDPRTPAAFLDRLDNDPAATALVDELLSAVAAFRQPSVVERLLALAERRDLWNTVRQVLLTISGADQPINDPDDVVPDKQWEKEQHPRHAGVLAKLMDAALQRSDTRFLFDRVPAARWSRGKEVDPVLALLVHHADANLRNAAVEAIGWRLRKRAAAADPLLKALRHRDPITQFLAAEGLARGKRPEGINVLLASLDYVDDVNQRGRAVQALGELGDARALDTLLKLANDAQHPLQPHAIEAIGHLGKSAQADEIFKILERNARSRDRIAANALVGLRWLDTRAGWQLVRACAIDQKFEYSHFAIEQLGFNDEPATRELLLRLLADPAEEMDYELMESARRLWGDASLDPDYASLRSGRYEHESLKRVCKDGVADRVFDILPHCDPAVQDELATSLLSRVDLPASHAMKGLDHADPRTVQLAGQILGRLIPAPKEAAKNVAKAVAKWAATWDERWQVVRRAGLGADDRLDRIAACLETLLWAAGKTSVPADALRPLVEAHPDIAAYRAIRLAALSALLQSPVTPATLKSLQTLAVGSDAAVRVVAVDALAKQPGAASLAEPLLTDRVSFQRLASQVAEPLSASLRQAGAQLHYQGVVLPQLIQRRDFDGLSAVLDNAKLPEAARLGALEALAALADERAERKLVEFGQSDQQPEPLRKAAWRAVHRSRRARKARV